MTKRRYNKRRKRGKGPSLAVMPHVRQPVPSAIVVHLKFSQSAVTASSTGVANEYVIKTFNTNSIYDPDQSGIGHQPRFHDQWANMYRKYYVRKCTVTIRMHNTNVTNTSGGYCITEHKSANDPTKVDPSMIANQYIIERCNSDKKCSLRRFHAVSNGASYWFTKKISVVPAFDLEGRDKHQNTGLFGANPATRTELRVTWVWPQASGTISQLFEYDVDYEVCLMDPIMPIAS